MPEIEWSIQATVRSDVTVVYDADTGDPVDVSGKSAPEVVAMLDAGTHLLAINDHYSGIRDCEHEDFCDIQGYLRDLREAREKNE